MGDRNDFPTTPSEMVHFEQLRSKNHTTHSSQQPHFEIHQNRIFAKSQPYTVGKSLLWLKLEATPIPNGESGVL